MDSNQTRLMLEGLRNTLIQQFKPSWKDMVVEFDMVDDPKNAKNGLVMIELFNPRMNHYMCDDSDSQLYVYVHHTSRLECKLMKEDLINFLDDTVVEGVRILVVEDEKPFMGMLSNSTLVAERIKLSLLY